MGLVLHALSDRPALPFHAKPVVDSRDNCCDWWDAVRSSHGSCLLLSTSSYPHLLESQLYTLCDRRSWFSLLLLPFSPSSRKSSLVKASTSAHLPRCNALMLTVPSKGACVRSGFRCRRGQQHSVSRLAGPCLTTATRRSVRGRTMRKRIPVHSIHDTD